MSNFGVPVYAPESSGLGDAQDNKVHHEQFSDLSTASSASNISHTPILTNNASPRQAFCPADYRDSMSASQVLGLSSHSNIDSTQLMAHPGDQSFMVPVGNARTMQVARGLRSIVRESVPFTPGFTPLSQLIHPGDATSQAQLQAHRDSLLSRGREELGTDESELRRKLPGRPGVAEATMASPILDGSGSMNDTPGMSSQLGAASSAYMPPYAPQGPPIGMTHGQYPAYSSSGPGGRHQGLQGGIRPTGTSSSGGPNSTDGGPLPPPQHYGGGYNPPQAHASSYMQPPYGMYYHPPYSTHPMSLQTPQSQPSMQYHYAPGFTYPSSFQQAAMHQQSLSNPYYYNSDYHSSPHPQPSSRPEGTIPASALRYLNNMPNDMMQASQDDGNNHHMMPFSNPYSQSASSGYAESVDGQKRDPTAADGMNMSYAMNLEVQRSANADYADGSSTNMSTNGNPSQYSGSGFYQPSGDLHISADRMVFRSKSNDADSVSSTDTSAPFSSTSSQYSLTPRAGQMPVGYECSPPQSDLSRMQLDGFHPSYITMTRPPSLGNLSGSISRAFPNANDYVQSNRHLPNRQGGNGSSELDSSVDSMNATAHTSSSSASIPGSSMHPYASMAAPSYGHSSTVASNAANGSQPYSVPMSPILSNGAPLHAHGNNINMNLNNGIQTTSSRYGNGGIPMNNSAMHMLPRSHVHLQLNSSNSYGTNNSSRASGNTNTTSASVTSSMGSMLGAQSGASAMHQVSAAPVRPPMMSPPIGSMRSQRRKRIKVSQ